ncbi:uncharacterized protein LOC124432070 [Vespa crabro]|uniref:uncharacterized protein LOC124432070 n=1 Tax=Vespa crabro TaxID=7445 RepID=UPI001F023D48|nr:uncharacterized protein LOC124432070 [Vespa crabro]
MILITTFAIISFSMLITTKAMNYTITKILDETVTVYENSLFDLEVIGFNNNSKAYMIIKKSITENDELLINFVAERFDGVKFPLPHNPMKLCKFLFEEQFNKSESYIQQFHISRAFNLEDQICPILPGKRKLLPYMFPKNITLLHDIGCGNFFYNVDLLTNTSDSSEYRPLISSQTTVHIEGDNCSNTLM